jgi:hypothetical protein
MYCREGLGKVTKNLNWGSRSPGRDFNSGPPECEAGVLTLDRNETERVRKDSRRVGTKRKLRGRSERQLLRGERASYC